jgi:hypothetical protein
METITPSFETLVKEIATINHAWKTAIALFESGSPLANSLRDLKTRKQVRLLRTYAPDLVYLKKDTQTEAEEDLYGLELVRKVESYQDAAHLPVRVAQEVLSQAELHKFIKS